ncbi:CDP-alcohol phosphatidyltransferase family protein [Candidatus Micrarchaeota archaeon]|nr:CDP-alcohol phosphatidyltransferase family protein [Candidatus Micrarchaeota archaeon]
MLKQNSALKELQKSIGGLLAVIPLSPGHWTLLSVLLALAGGTAIAFYNSLGAGLGLFAVAAAFDLIDGAVARAKNQASEWGGFLDGVADRFVEGIFLISFMFYPLPVVLIGPEIWIALVVFLGTCMPSFIRAYSDHKGVLSREKALALGGICERSERLLIIIAGLAAGMLFNMDYFIYGLIAASVLSLTTVLQRFLEIRKDALQ